MVENKHSQAIYASYTKLFSVCSCCYSVIKNAIKFDTAKCVQNVRATETSEAEYETPFAQDTSFPENEAAVVTDIQLSEAKAQGTGSYIEHHELAASDEDSDSDDANTTSRHRDRFRTERVASDSKTLLSAPANKADKRDIPDTLGETCWLCLGSKHSFLHLYFRSFLRSVIIFIF